MFSATAEVVFNHVNEYVHKVDLRATLLIDEMAERIRKSAEEHARRRTGDMAEAFEIIKIGATREIINTSEHFIYNEFGTRKMPAQPMLTPAARDEEIKLDSTAHAALREVTP